jgi:hypothetical protein
MQKKWDLELRSCAHDECSRTFKVLPTSDRHHCCEMHKPQFWEEYRDSRIGWQGIDLMKTGEVTDWAKKKTPHADKDLKN